MRYTFQYCPSAPLIFIFSLTQVEKDISVGLTLQRNWMAQYLCTWRSWMCQNLIILSLTFKRSSLNCFWNYVWCTKELKRSRGTNCIKVEVSHIELKCAHLLDLQNFPLFGSSSVGTSLPLSAIIQHPLYARNCPWLWEYSIE